MLKAKRAVWLLLLMIVFSGSAARAATYSSTTVLTISPSTSVTAGTAVMLTATVTANSSPVTAGEVIFCDATAAHCEDSAVFGTAELTSAGTASLKYVPGAGTYSIVAEFVASHGVTTSSSSSQSLTVSGNSSYFSTASLVSSGSVGNYSLAGTVNVFGRGAVSGTLSFLDASNSDATVATAPLDPVTLGFAPQSAPDIATDAASYYAVVVDLNGDGINDVAVTNQQTDDITIATGKGDGTFNPPTNVSLADVCIQPTKIVTGDFNGDGYTDLAVSCEDNGGVDVLISNGSGTFQQTFYGVYGPAYNLAVGDFNNDGHLDLAVTLDEDSGVQILLGDGTGAFALESSESCDGVCYFQVGNGAWGIAAVDLNNDGNLDLVVVNSISDSISILMGNGDGTFQPQTTLPTGSGPSDIAVADFNEDGFEDVVVGNSDGTISRFINADGVLTASPSIPADGGASGLAVGDFNGDGHMDIAAAFDASGQVAYILGNGDGTFQLPQTVDSTGFGPTSVAVGDLNGDGLPDVVAVNVGDECETSLATVLLSAQSESGTATGVSITGAGTHEVLAAYPGDEERASSESNEVPLQGLVATATALTGSPNPSTYGQSVTLTATITPTPTGETYGSVTFYNGASSVGTGNVNSSGVATLQTTALPVGTLSLTATYGGNSDGYQTSTSTALSFVVNQAFTTTAINSVAPNPPVSGQSVTLTATVSPAPTGETYGSVSFYNGETLVGTGNVNSSGVATYSTTSLSAGALDLIAVYSGNTNFSGSTSSADDLTVLAATSTALAASPSPANYGQLVTLTATVSPTPTGPPLGTVSFYDAETLLGSGTVNSSGVATFTTSTLSVFAHSLTANYSGNAAFAASDSTTTSLIVNTAPTATALIGAPNPSTWGQSVTLTATVSPAPDGPPYGTASFYNGETLLGTGNVNSSGVATLTTTSLPVGTLGLTAAYSGNTDFAGSTSSSYSFLVNQVSTATGLAAAPNPATTGQSVTLTATITPTPTGTPFGTVTFFNGATQVGSAATVNSSGVATLTTTTLPAGVLSLTAIYSGNTDFAGSTSSAQSETVLAATATALVGSPNPSTYGQSVTLTATVSPAPTGPPLGTVSFYDGETLLGSVGVNSSGVATFTSSTLSVGSHSLTADYVGNAAFAASSSSLFSLVVNLAPTATALAATPNPTTYGQSVTLTATVTPAPTGSSLGTVNFYNGETLLGTGNVNSSGIATFSSASLPVGTLSLTAIYSGNSNFGGSTSTVLSQVVNQVATVTVLAASPSPAVTGQSVTLTATVTPAPTGGSLGTVNFYNGATQVGSAATVNSSGVATLSTSNLPAGVLSLTATYSGNTNFVGSTSSAQSLTVLAATTTTLTALPNPSTYGQSVTFTATVSPAPTGSPLGTVSFYNGETLLGTGNVNASGVAAFTSTTLAVASYSLTAVYSGNTGFNTSTSSVVMFTVNLTPTATTLTASPSPATYGQSVTLTATVAPVPTGSSLGTVSFYNGETLLGTGTLSASGVATYSSTALPAGALTLNATYSGNGNFASSAASEFSLTVNTTYTVNTTQSSFEVSEGGSVQIDVNVPPLGGSFNNVVVMSATGLPPGATATFVPPSVTPGAEGAPTVLTIQLAPVASGLVRPASPAANGDGPRFALTAALIDPRVLSALAAVIAVVVVLTVPRRKSMARALQFAAFIIVVALLGTALAGCSGGFPRPPSTQPGSYVIAITGTSGSLHQSTTVTVAVE